MEENEFMRLIVIILCFILLITSSALAQEVASSENSFGNMFQDNVFLITILFVFLSAVITAIIKAHTKDKCLKHFQDYHITLEELDGDLCWGILNVYTTGIELGYRRPHLDDDGHIESSYILYKEQYEDIHALYRFSADQDEANRIRRNKDIKRAYNPNTFRRLGRRLGNLINTLQDAFMQSMGLVLGQIKKASPGSLVLRTQEERLTKIGKNIIGHIGNTYDPILEKYIGSKVILEITKNNTTIEYEGILKEYSSQFLEILNVKYPLEQEISLQQVISLANISPKKETDSTNSDEIYDDKIQKAVEEWKITLTLEDNKIIVHNNGDQLIHLKKLQGVDYEHNLDVVISPNTIADFFLEKENITDLQLVLEIIRNVDIIVPRTHALIRHGGERKIFKWKDILEMFENKLDFDGKK